MFDLRPFNRKREDLFEKFAKTFDEVFDQNLFPTFDGKLKSLRTDIQEGKDAYLVQADLPGFAKDDIEIELENNQLTIRAKREENKETKDKKNKTIRQERHFGEFVRSFYVDNIDEEKVEATLEDGVLNIKLPKIKKDDEEPSKRINIK